MLLDAGAIIDAKDMNGDIAVRLGQLVRAPGERFCENCVMEISGFLPITGLECKPICWVNPIRLPEKGVK